jgi:hypothetical protein
VRRAHAEADVAADLGEERVELVPDRDAADQIGADLGHQERHGDAIRGQVEPAPLPLEALSGRSRSSVTRSQPRRPGEELAAGHGPERPPEVCDAFVLADAAAYVDPAVPRLS